MSEQAVLWVLGAFITALGALLGIIYRAQNARLKTLEDRVGTSEFAAFKGMDSERERGWWAWRNELEADRQRWRQDTTKRLDAHAEDIKELTYRTTKLERNGH